MKWLIVIMCLMIFSCRSVRYMPVEKVKTEYRDRVEKQRDSVYLSDTVKIIERGDSVLVYRDRYRYVYQDRYLRDTAFVRDSIPVPYLVEVVKNKVPGVMWWLVVVLAVVSLPTIWKVIRFFRGKF